MELNQIYKCSVCGNTVELVFVGGGQLVCCSQPMQALNPKSTEEGTEKHLPVVTNNNGKVTVKIGSTPHPMEASHYITFVELIEKSGKICRKYLNPTDLPQVEFSISPDSQISSVRIYCNIHGLWQS